MIKKTLRFTIPTTICYTECRYNCWAITRTMDKDGGGRTITTYGQGAWNASSDSGWPRFARHLETLDFHVFTLSRQIILLTQELE